MHLISKSLSSHYPFKRASGCNFGDLVRTVTMGLFIILIRQTLPMQKKERSVRKNRGGRGKTSHLKMKQQSQVFWALHRSLNTDSSSNTTQRRVQNLACLLLALIVLCSISNILFSKKYAVCHSHIVYIFVHSRQLGNSSDWEKQ
jgi:hypothetical protein